MKRFWKQIYACGRSEPFYWKEGEGKEVIWAMLEKSLMRQKVFLHCAMDHDTVHDLNEECVHVKITLDLTLKPSKRCTEHPRIVSQHSYWRHKRCSSWIGKHHWRNEPHERFGPEKSMVRHPNEEYSPRSP